MSSATPVRRVEKASCGLRPLGIPMVLDRFIQQAVMRVLQVDRDETLSETSFGCAATSRPTPNASLASLPGDAASP